MTGRDWVAWLSPGLLILAGVVLFFIPAPPTSILGIGLIGAGLAMWLVDYFTGRSGEERETEPDVRARR